MSRGQRLQVLHSRTLRWGLGLSLAIHAAVLGFGRFNLGPTPAEETAQRSLARVLEQPIPADRALQLIDLRATESLSETSDPNEVAGSKPADLKLTPLDVPTPATFAEAAMILAKADLEEPVVPRPRLVPETVESGLTPIRAVRTGAIVLAKEPGRRRGGGIRVVIGTGDCPPGPGGFTILVNNRRPRFGGFRGGR